MSDLYALDPDLVDRPLPPGMVLLQALSGFVDAGGAARLARDTLLEAGSNRVVARFDVDRLHDYRARRPIMTFVEDHWEAYDAPQLVVRELHDADGVPFLLLDGPEPDVQWERFAAAVTELVGQLGVRLTVGLTAIPMAVPHTRPVGVTAHGTRPELAAGYPPWVGTIAVPASAGNLMEYRLGQAGHDAMGFAVHVPHYAAQMEYPPAAVALLRAVATSTGLVVPTETLAAAAASTLAQIDEQVASAEEVADVVRGLEQQYDAFQSARGQTGLLAADGSRLPTADELGAELERFLAEHGDGPETGRG